MTRIAADITELIGETPLLELGGIARAHELSSRLLGKLEFLNPTRSVKDRLAWAVLRDAEQRGLLGPGSLLLDYSSGNTGVALAALAAARGYRARFLIGDNTSPDKRRLIEAFGAEVVEVPNERLTAPGGDAAALAEYAQAHPEAFVTDQDGNPANAATHRAHTGPEIWRDTLGEVDVLVAGAGTGGTVSGTGSFLKERRPDIRVVVVQPDDASVPSAERLYPDEIDGVHQVHDVPAEYLPGNFDPGVVDEVIPVAASDAYRTARELLRHDGLFVGASAGAIVWGALQLAKRPEHRDATIVTIVPDAGDRYLTAALYRDPAQG